ncbi:MAG: DUF87 domain-containing protein [Clostridiales bacterium]|nr:DUF87 domain-containing protein [Clostridiales bacterium]
MIFIANPQIQINNELLNVVTPHGGIEFFSRKFTLGDIYARIYGIIKYPADLPFAWAAKISALPYTVACQVFEPLDNGALLSELSKSAQRYRQILESTRDPLEQQRAERASKDAENLLLRIDTNNEVVGFMSNIILVYGRDEAALENNSKVFLSAVASLNCRARLLFNNQMEAFGTLSPYNVPDESILKILRRNIPVSTMIEGFLWASNSFVDKEGYPFGRNTRGGLIVLDPWVRANDRSNSNWVVLGVPGSGKSTAIKYMMISEFMFDTVCIVIDPQDEYKDLTKALGGDVINAGGGNYIINPLQFRVVPDVFDVDDEANTRVVNEADKGMPPLSLHLKTLEIFFKLYNPEMTTKQFALIEQLLELLYARFNITWETDVSGLTSTDYPTFSDLYDLVNEMIKERRLSDAFKDDILEVEIIMRRLAIGADSFIWNGHTSAEPKSEFICFNTSGLEKFTENIKRAQYYNILSWSWERMSRNRNEKTMLFADEAYLLVDPQVPQALQYMRNIAKQARKYEAGLCVIFHSVIDVMHEAVRAYGQALLDLPTYKFLLGTDGKNLQDLTNLYDLTEAEQSTLARKNRGEGILFVGSRRFINKLVISDYDLQLMGKGGGR